MPVRTRPAWRRPEVRDRVRLVTFDPAASGLSAVAHLPESREGSPNDSEEEKPQ